MEKAQIAITEDQVYDALRQCFNPEIPVNIVDLGPVYKDKIIDNCVGVKMTLTAPDVLYILGSHKT